MTRAEFRTRTFQFGIRSIRLAESLPKTTVAQIIAKQLILLMKTGNWKPNTGE